MDTQNPFSSVKFNIVCLGVVTLKRAAGNGNGCRFQGARPKLKLKKNRQPDGDEKMVLLQKRKTNFAFCAVKSDRYMQNR